MGDGRQSGTSESPSILNASPEAVVSGGLAFANRRPGAAGPECAAPDALVDAAEWQARKDAWQPPELVNQTPGRRFIAGMSASLPMAAVWNWRRPIIAWHACCRATTTRRNQARTPGTAEGRRMTGKSIIITGAGSGIGRHRAHLLVAGWRVGLIGRREDALRETANGAPAAIVLPCDVVDPAEVDAAFDRAFAAWGI